LKIKVTSPSFSKNEILVKKLKKIFKNVEINKEGIRFTKNELINFLKDADAAIIGLEKIDKEVIDNTNLKAVSKYGVGLDNIDIEYLQKKGIKFCFKAGINSKYVAEFTLGLIISSLRNIVTLSNKLKQGEFIKNGGFSLFNKKVGIIGVGNIGKEVVKLLKPFNVEIFVNDIIDQTDYYKKNNLVEVNKEYIFKNCDVITIHTPLTEKTKNMINKNTFEMIKENALVINTARGEIINFKDLKEILKRKDILVASDVFSPEPPTDMELLQLEKFIPTPHIAGNSRESILAMGHAAIDSLKECLQ
jgi:phosphoglycerate dehydrogenase-like enzyme